jgi:NADH-quinone oxidoreductase subunit K
MPTVPLEYGMLLAAAVTLVGLTGVLVRRNLLLLLMSLELMLNGAAMAFIVAGAKWGQADGQVMFLFVLAVTATETGIALALMLRFHHHLRTLDADRGGQAEPPGGTKG